jgi:hypothetical protein
MNAKIFYKLSTGEIFSVEENTPEDNAVLIVNQSAYIDHKKQYVSEGQLLMRPVIEAQESYSLLVSQPLVLTVPIGTKVYLNSEFLGETDEDSVSFVFGEEDLYSIKLVPPWPWLQKEFEIAVSN